MHRFARKTRAEVLFACGSPENALERCFRLHLLQRFVHALREREVGGQVYVRPEMNECSSVKKCEEGWGKRAPCQTAREPSSLSTE